MGNVISTPKQFIDSLPDDRRPAITKLRSTLRKHLPKGFKEEFSGTMLGYVVPHKLYPAGYHVDPAKPLPFINLANQKNFIGLYHMGIYADPALLKWFTQSYQEQVSHKLDMGKSCIRLKKIDDIPYDLIAELAASVTPKDWIALYEKSIKG